VFLGRINSRATRNSDIWGSGQFGASRAGHMHQGLDVITRPGEPILSPIDGIIKREALPYAGDSRLKGLTIIGFGTWEGIEVKLFYVSGWLLGTVKRGQPIGVAQDLSVRYPGITNHVHIEVRSNGILQNPAQLFGVCF
jgi:murein DD-endopeptidase MepM/ murein hydrolase activator NlpD